MVKHIIVWKLKEDLTEIDKLEAKKRVKRELEALINKIPGIIKITVNIEPLESSSADMMLDSTFESRETLAVYQTHPEHVKAAGFVRSVVASRSCMDYLE